MVRKGNLNITVALIMTATVTPPANAPGLMRVDPKLRMGDYVSALDFYIGELGKSIDYIIFVDNSDADLSPLQKLAETRGVSSTVNLIAYPGLDYPPEYGRCYGEMRLLNYAMANSVVRALPIGTVFWKVTGRYKVRNLGALVCARPSDAAFYCDMRIGSSPWMDMRVMSWTRDGFEGILTDFHEEIREDINQGRPGEETAYLQLGPRIGSTPVCLCLNREPLIDGIRAYDNQNWSQGRQRIVYHLRQLQRLVLRRVIF